MATNRAYGGEPFRLSLPIAGNTGSGPDDAIASGDPVVVGSLPGVAVTDEGAEGNADGFATIELGAGTAVYNLNVDGEVDEGDPVYHDGSETLTTVTTSNALFGHAVESKGGGEGVIAVLVAPQVV